jgi:hypothetical protein
VKRAIILLAMLAAAGLAGAQMFAQMFGAAASLPSGPLPAGWTECEYLESTGTQFLTMPTGLLTTNSFFYFEYQVVSNIVNKNNGIFGTTGGASRYGAFLPTPATGTEHRYFYGGSSFLSYSGGNARQTAVLEHPELKFYTNGVLVASRTGVNTGTNDGTTFRLFSIGGFNATSASRFWSFTLKDRGAATNRINLVPALDTNGIPCMFDTVTQTPLYNAGTGDFLYQIKEQ